jgi:hypothetical protein
VNWQGDSGHHDSQDVLPRHRSVYPAVGGYPAVVSQHEVLPFATIKPFPIILVIAECARSRPQIIFRKFQAVDVHASAFELDRLTFNCHDAFNGKPAILRVSNHDNIAPLWLPKKVFDTIQHERLRIPQSRVHAVAIHNHSLEEEVRAEEVAGHGDGSGNDTMNQLAPDRWKRSLATVSVRFPKAIRDLLPSNYKFIDPVHLVCS